MGGRTDLMVWFGWVGTIASVLMLFFVGVYVKKLGKRWGIALVEALCLVCSVVVLVAAPGQNAVLCTVALLASVFMFNFTNTLSRSAVLDAANYAEIRTGVSCNAVISSTFTFVNKCCQAFSAAFAGHILTWTGYNKDLVQQSDGTLQAILYLMTLVPIVAYICSLIGMWWYPISRKDELEMEEKLVEKRAAALK
jgi:Na+/melibiose symporter-like transporter